MSQVMIEAEDNGTVRWYYIYGARGMTARISPGGQIQYYHHNWRGDTEVMTDHTGNMIANYHYDSYGHAYDRVESTPNSFLYGGQYGAIQLDSTLIHLRGRCLDPLHRRMYQYDPIENVNGYYPMDGDPMNKVDPLGMSTESLVGAGSIASMPFNYSYSLKDERYYKDIYQSNKDLKELVVQQIKEQSFDSSIEFVFSFKNASLALEPITQTSVLFSNLYNQEDFQNLAIKGNINMVGSSIAVLSQPHIGLVGGLAIVYESNNVSNFINSWRNKGNLLDASRSLVRKSIMGRIISSICNCDVAY